MNRRERTGVVSRLIGADELMVYLGLGKTSAVRFAQKAGATRKIGRRTLYDVKVLDKVIDELA